MLRQKIGYALSPFYRNNAVAAFDSFMKFLNEERIWFREPIKIKMVELFSAQTSRVTAISVNPLVRKSRALNSATNPEAFCQSPHKSRFSSPKFAIEAEKSVFELATKFFAQLPRFPI